MPQRNVKKEDGRSQLIHWLVSRAVCLTMCDTRKMVLGGLQAWRMFRTAVCNDELSSARREPCLCWRPKELGNPAF